MNNYYKNFKLVIYIIFFFSISTASIRLLDDPKEFLLSRFFFEYGYLMQSLL